jgi:hypothetical protein
MQSGVTPGSHTALVDPQDPVSYDPVLVPGNPVPSLELGPPDVTDDPAGSGALSLCGSPTVPASSPVADPVVGSPSLSSPTRGPHPTSTEPTIHVSARDHITPSVSHG